MEERLVSFDEKDGPDNIEVDGQVKPKLKIHVVRPTGDDGKPRDQTEDAAKHMRYAAALNLPRIVAQPPHAGRAIIVGGAPSITQQLAKIKELAALPNSSIFCLNWTHNWLLQNGIMPQGCVFFEIDAEPDDILGKANDRTIYFVCSHCHEKTFDQLLTRVPKEHVVLWHMIPDCEPTKTAFVECFLGDPMIGGGLGTFLRTCALALGLGYRDFDLFGVDSSFPVGGKSTHVEGYPTIVDPNIDGFDVWARDKATEEVKHFRTVAYLSMQVEEFKLFCKQNHHMFTMRVHGDGLLPWTHQHMWPGQYK